MPSFQQFAAIFLGSLLIAIGIDFYLLPFKIMDGGFIGIALIFHYLFGSKIGSIIIVCSIPVFFTAWVHERIFPYGSLLGMLLSSIFTDILEPYHFYFLYYIELSPISSSIIGGILVGSGLGVMLRYNVSTGGTDLMAHYLAKGTRINVGLIILLIDIMVISLGGWLISAETFFLSVLTVAAGGVATFLLTIHKPEEKITVIKQRRS